jgi:hypothetical protein
MQNGRRMACWFVRTSWTSTLCQDCWKLAAGLRLVGKSNRCSSRLRITTLFCTWYGVLSILPGYETIATKFQIAHGGKQMSMNSRSRVFEIPYTIKNPEDSETIGLMVSRLKSENEVLGIGLDMKFKCWRRTWTEHDSKSTKMELSLDFHRFVTSAFQQGLVSEDGLNWPLNHTYFCTHGSFR